MLEITGFECSDMIDNGFIHSLYDFDPNGIPIEFSRNVRRIEIRSEPVMRNRLLSGLSCEGDRPQSEHWPTLKKSTHPTERRIYFGAETEFRYG
jgi:hypothetical protein